MTQFLTETRERFLVAIAEQIASDRIAEVHFFKPIKQGGVESGVAVIALTMPPAPVVAIDAEGEFPLEDESPVEAVAPIATSAARHTVVTAHYRLTLKGIDRGKWQVMVVEEADAPLITVEMVVRGVQRRAGDLDDPDRMDAEGVASALQAALARTEAGRTPAR